MSADVSIAVPIAGLLVFGVLGAVCTFWPRVLQEYVGSRTWAQADTVTLRVAGAFLLVFAAIVAYAAGPDLAVALLAAGGAAYAFWPRTVQRLTRAHLESRLYTWEVRVGGVLSLIAAGFIAYALLTWPPR